jgi:MFS transporter, OFA family, oxalate/formate antiporter
MHGVFFQKPIVETYGWSNSAVAWAFSTNILFLGLAAAWGGINMPKYGPTKLAMIGTIMYGGGFMLGALAFSIQSLPLLIVGFGVIGGSGIGLGYVTPVVSASKWFPDKQGLVTGMVVMGFGLGALIMSKLIAPVVIKMVDGNLVSTFLYIGIILLVLGFLLLSLLNSPLQIMFLKDTTLLPLLLLQMLLQQTSLQNRQFLHQNSSECGCFFSSTSVQVSCLLDSNLP